MLFFLYLLTKWNSKLGTSRLQVAFLFAISSLLLDSTLLILECISLERLTLAISNMRLFHRLVWKVLTASLELDQPGSWVVLSFNPITFARFLAPFTVVPLARRMIIEI